MTETLITAPPTKIVRVDGQFKQFLANGVPVPVTVLNKAQLEGVTAIKTRQPAKRSK